MRRVDARDVGVGERPAEQPLVAAAGSDECQDHLVCVDALGVEAQLDVGAEGVDLGGGQRSALACSRLEVVFVDNRVERAFACVCFCLLHGVPVSCARLSVAKRLSGYATLPCV